MTAHASDEYLQSAVMTATPEQLQLMLYDGALRFCGHAKQALQRKDFETSCEKLIRAQRIVSQLRAGLRPEVNPSLCEQLAAIYDFVYRRLVNANMLRKTEPIDEAVQILEHQRETWLMLMDKIKKLDQTGDGPDAAAPERATSLCLEC